MQSTTPRGRPALHTMMSLSSLSLGILAMAGVAATATYTIYVPTESLAAGTSPVGPMLVAVLLVLGLAAACWIVSLNTRPAPTVGDRLAAIDAEQERINELRASLVGSVLPPQPTTARRLPSPRRRRERVKVDA